MPSHGAPDLPLTLAGIPVYTTVYTSVRNLGVMFDKDLSLTSHVNGCQRASRAADVHSKYTTIVNTLIVTRLDYCIVYL